MTSEFYAALGGALAGGLISLVLQFLGYWREDRLRKSDRRTRLDEAAEAKLEQDAVYAFSLLAKIGRAHTDIVTIHDHLKEGWERAQARDGSLVSTTLPLASDPPKLELSLEEMILMRDIKNDAVLNDAMNFTHVHAMYVDGMREFRQLRRDMAALTSKTTFDTQGMASSVFEGANASIAQNKQKEANDLLSSLIEFSRKDIVMITNLFYDAQKALLEKLGKDRLRIEWAVERIPTEPA